MEFVKMKKNGDGYQESNLRVHTKDELVDGFQQASNNYIFNAEAAAYLQKRFRFHSIKFYCSRLDNVWVNFQVKSDAVSYYFYVNDTRPKCIETDANHHMTYLVANGCQDVKDGIFSTPVLTSSDWRF